MGLTYLLLFITLSTFAQNRPRIQVLPNPQSLEDFDHEFKGCPENSECDQVMGHMLSNWKSLTGKLKETIDQDKISKELEMFRSKYGIPVEFYTIQKSQQSFKPSIHSSPCKEHNPKTGEKILRGTAFVKSISLDKAIIWRDQSQIELPLSDILVPQLVKAYYDNGPVTYFLPLNDQPLFIKNRELYVLREDDGLYYTLKISENGNWKIVMIEMSNLSLWEDKRQDVVCPKDKEATSTIFTNQFCKSIINLDTNKVMTVRMGQGCLI